MGNYVGRQTRSDSVGSLESFRRSISQSLMNKGNRLVFNIRSISVDELVRWFFLIFSKPNASEPPVSKSRCSIEKIPYRVEHLLELGKADMETQVRFQRTIKSNWKFSLLIGQFKIMHGWNPLDKSVNIFVKGMAKKLWFPISLT